MKQLNHQGGLLMSSTWTCKVCEKENKKSSAGCTCCGYARHTPAPERRRSGGFPALSPSQRSSKIDKPLSKRKKRKLGIE